jgi:hypothetical protein
MSTQSDCGDKSWPETLFDNLRVSRKSIHKQSAGVAWIIGGRVSVDVGGEKFGRVERSRRNRLTVEKRPNPVNASRRMVAR